MDLAHYEAWYAGLLYVCWTTIGQSLRVEDPLSFGQPDLVLLGADRIIVVELKVTQGDGKMESVLELAIKQMQNRDYAKRYQAKGKSVHLGAMEFDREQRNLASIRERGPEGTPVTHLIKLHATLEQGCIPSSRWSRSRGLALLFL